jgi:plastocyanin
MLLGIAVTAAGCKKAEQAATEAPAAPPTGPAASGGDGSAGAASKAGPPAASGVSTIQGVARLTGAAPAMKMLKREGDPFCARKQMQEEDVVVGEGGTLGNVIVRITQGVSGNYDPPMNNAVLDQVDCMYRPRVQGIMAGQSLLIKNSDQTLHNVHTYKGASTVFNQAQVPGLPPMAKKFNNAGDVIKFKCDVHPWMTAYVAVSNHPFFAVTTNNGSFSIPKVPAGTYTVEAWHERYGAKTRELTLVAGKATDVNFDFAPN